MTQIEAQVADCSVKLEERRSELARSEQRLVDTQRRIRTLENDYRLQASDQLKITTARLAEIEQEQRNTGDAARRQVIVAPTAREIIALRVHAPGAVIGARETVAEIVPSARRLVIEARLRPEDIDRIQNEQATYISFAARAYRSARLVHGKVAYVSADRLVDWQTGAPYFVAQVEADVASLWEPLPRGRFIRGACQPRFTWPSRTAVEYLYEPLRLAIARGARERSAARVIIYNARGGRGSTFLPVAHQRSRITRSPLAALRTSNREHERPVGVDCRPWRTTADRHPILVALALRSYPEVTSRVRCEANAGSVGRSYPAGIRPPCIDRQSIRGESQGGRNGITFFPAARAST